MCTVTLIPVKGAASGYRMVFSRDELRSRGEGEPPRWHTLGTGLRYIAPRDPDAGGTWIASNTRGLTVAVTNLNPRPMPPMPTRAALVSRGTLVPGLIGEADSAQVVAKIAAYPLDHFAPFRLIAVSCEGDSYRTFDAAWDRRELRVSEHGAAPLCFVSSGLGDAMVAERLSLFEREFGAGTRDVQDAFHDHRWADRPAVSVRMSREDARTVSITGAEVRGAEGLFDICMDYRAISDQSEVPASLASGVAQV